MHKQGISFGNGPDTEIAVGHRVYESIPSGTPPVDAIYELMREGADSNSAAIIVGCAIAFKP